MRSRVSWLTPMATRTATTPPRRRRSRVRKPKGRRNLADADLPEVVVEVPDDDLEKLVAEGKARRIGAEVSYKLGYQRGGARRIKVVRVTYQTVDAEGESVLETAPKPPELLKRSLAAPSLLAYIAVAKFCDGLPFYRQEDILGREGASVDRGTMSRWME